MIDSDTFQGSIESNSAKARVKRHNAIGYTAETIAPRLRFGSVDSPRRALREGVARRSKAAAREIPGLPRT